MYGKYAAENGGGGIADVVEVAHDGHYYASEEVGVCRGRPELLVKLVKALFNSALMVKDFYFLEAAYIFLNITVKLSYNRLLPAEVSLALFAYFFAEENHKRYYGGGYEEHYWA